MVKLIASTASPRMDSCRKGDRCPSDGKAERHRAPDRWLTRCIDCGRWQFLLWTSWALLDFCLHTACATDRLAAGRARHPPGHPACRRRHRSPLRRLAPGLDTEHLLHLAGYRRDAHAAWQTALDATAHLADPTTRVRAHRYLGHACSRPGLHKEAAGHLMPARALGGMRVRTSS